MHVTKLVIHHSATNRATTTRNSIDIAHRNRKPTPYTQIGYHKVIEGNGDIKDGRPESIKGAHAFGANNNSLGVCVAGNFESEIPTAGQIDSLVDVLVNWCVENNINQTAIYGHFEVPGGKTKTLCPGKNMKLEINSIRARVKEGIEKKINNYL